MTEMRTKDYKARTRQNVLESDGTLIINMGVLKSGTALTVKIAQEYNKPLLIVQLDHDYEPGVISRWINENQIEILNVAGPRESKVPGIYEKAKALLVMAFQKTIYLTT